jgi:hypothetical protein
MHSSNRSHLTSPNVHTKRRWLGRLTSLLSVVALSGCFVVVDDEDDGRHNYPDPDPDPIPVAVEEVFIDEGERLEAEPGVGVGVFVEYLGAGTWHVWTTCDTENHGYQCNFDIGVAGYGLTTIDPEDLEGYDAIDQGVDNASIFFETGVDTDGVFIQIEELQPLTVEVYLDDADGSGFVSWVEDAVALQGAPSNPVAFVP